ncbi:MAG: MBG domain-containing protein, partial [Planctomycetota bacterium]
MSTRCALLAVVLFSCCCFGEDAPVITSDLTTTGTVGQDFSYTITADNNPTSYDATGLPSWASVDPDTGAITGTPDAAGETDVTISATNDEGTDSEALTLTVGKGSATVYLDGLSQTYDGNAKSASTTTDPEGLSVDITYNDSSQAPTDAGTYAVVATINDANYEGSASDTLTVAQALLTVTAATDSKTYDGTTSSAGVPTITSGALQGTDTDTGCWTQDFDSKNVGTDKTLTPAGSVNDGNGGNNYNVTFTPVYTGTITTTTLTVTAAMDSKTYDGTTSSAGVPTITSGALQGSDTDSGCWTQDFDTQNVGTFKTLTPTGAVNDGNGGSNYNLTLTPVNSGAITAVGLTVSGIGASDKVYDGTTAATLTGTPGTLQGVVGMENVWLSGMPAGTFADKNAGTGKTVTVSGQFLAGTDTANYTLTEPATTASINAAPLAVRADAQKMVYGASVPALTYTYTGLVNGDTSATFTGALGTNGMYNPPGVGTCQTTVGSLQATGNYYIYGFTGANLVVEAAPVAYNDSYTVEAGTPLYADGHATGFYGVLYNDSGPADFTLTAVLATDPSNGTLWLSSDGTFVYMPQAGYVGWDYFTYTARAGGVDSAPATVSILVQDTIAPQIDNWTPADGAVINNAQPAISADITDFGSGVDWGELQVKVDGGLVTPGTTAAGFTYTPAADLAFGAHTVWVSVCDYAATSNGNVAEWTFSIQPIITTTAGTGVQGFAGDGNPPTSAALYLGYENAGIATDSSGNLYIADYSNHRVRKIDAGSGTISTVAGNGTATFAGDSGPATAASLNFPAAVAVDSSGNVYIADSFNYRIRKVDATTGYISTLAGTGSYGYSGDNGPATSAALSQPTGVAVDAMGNVYIADCYNNRIRMVDHTGYITTVAGNGTAGYSGDGGAATSAELNTPEGVTAAWDGFYIADSANNCVRKVDTGGTINKVAGGLVAGFGGDGYSAIMASLDGPKTVALDSSGNLFIADCANNRIRQVDTSGIIHTYAGDGDADFSGDGGSAPLAALNSPAGVAVDAATGALYISDQGNNRVRRVGADIRPAAPSGLTAMATSSSQISLTWADNSSNEKWFKIARMVTTNGNFAEIAYVAANTTSYADTTVQTATGY